MSFVSSIQGARQSARIASVQARGEQFNAGTPAIFQDGVVTAVTGETYTVDVIGDDGLTVATYERVRPRPAAVLSVDQAVILRFDPGPGGAHPSIFTGGGGVTGCDIAPTMLGALTIV